MEKWREKMAKVMEETDPHEAMIGIARIIREENLSLVEMEIAVSRYMERHGVDLDEMTFYPNGERVLEE